MKKGITIVLIILLLAAVTFRVVRYLEARDHKAERVKLEQVYEEAVTGKGPSKPAAPKEVIGRIMIPSLNINYIILDHTTNKTLAISISKVVGPDIFGKGNLVLAGHNMRNGSFFGRLKEIGASDTITLEDRSGKKKDYVMVKKYIVPKNDLSPLTQKQQTESYLTLITCAANPENRLIVVAKSQGSQGDGSPGFSPQD